MDDEKQKLLDEVERLRAEHAVLWERAVRDSARATRAEAHAERLASLMGEMFESGTVEVAFAGNPIPCDDLERRIRSALSAYRGEMKTVLGEATR